MLLEFIFIAVTKFFLSVFLILSTLALNVEGAPTIKQIFPKQHLYLGETLDWIIDVRYPLWESYEVNLQAPQGAEMRIAEKTQESIGNEMRCIYRIRITPQSLTVNGTPSILITDGRGTNSVLNGKPIIVQTISGASTEIKDPSIPRFRKMQRPIHLLLGGISVIVLIALWIFLRIRRKYNSSPRQMLLRQLRRLRLELQGSGIRNPLALSKLLRSELIWGFAAESLTSSELNEKADEKKKVLADALSLLDLTRYSPEPDQIETKTVEEALSVAIEILSEKVAEQKPRGKAA